MAEPVPGISAVPDESNARYFHVIVAGPEGVGVHLFLLKLIIDNALYSHHSKVVSLNLNSFCLKNIQCLHQKCDL